MSEAKPLPVSDWMTEPESADYCRCSLASFRNMRLPASNSGGLVSTNSTPPPPTSWPTGFRPLRPALRGDGRLDGIRDGRLPQHT